MEQEPMCSPGGVRSFVGWVVVAARAFSISVEVFLHEPGSFGERAVGLNAGVAMVLMFLAPLAGGGNVVALLIFMGLFAIACMRVRLAVARRCARGGPQPHSVFTGTPILKRFIRGVNETTIKCFAEPMLTFLGGCFLMPVSEALGGYVMLAGLGLFISNNLAVGHDRRRAMDMNDAYLDQKSTFEQFRNMRGGR